MPELDEKNVGRQVARADGDECKRDHDLLIPVTVFSESIVAPYRRSQPDGQRAEAALAALGSVLAATRDIASRAAQAPRRATDQAPGCARPGHMQVAAEPILTLDRSWLSVDSRVLLLEP